MSDHAGYAYEEAVRLKNWYASFCWCAKIRYQVSEVVLLIVSASVPVAGILAPGDARWAAILGAAVTALVGFRAVFHWRENWNRGSVACSALVGEMRSYSGRLPPYDDDDTRDRILIEKLNEIEKSETQGWSSLLTTAPSTPVHPTQELPTTQH